MPGLLEECSDTDGEVWDQEYSDTDEEALDQEGTTEPESPLCVCGRKCPENLRNLHSGLNEYSPECYARHTQRLQQIEEDLGELVLEETLADLEEHLKQLEEEPLFLASAKDNNEIIDI